MELDAKYYTPDISEFHVGFEYEIKLNGGKWEKHIFCPNSENFSHRFKEETWFTKEDSSRVKHLDRSDIESFGFEGQEKNNTYFKKEGFRLVNWPKEPKKILVFRVFGDNDETRIFEGTIKNKSELKKVLQQIGAI